MHKYSPLFDKAPYNIFALPATCKLLYDAGLDIPQVFCWVVNSDNFELSTLFFDPDSYYKDAISNIGFISGSRYIPAYSITDLLQLLPPGYSILQVVEKEMGEDYEVALWNYYALSSTKHPRLVDAVALMVLKQLNEHKGYNLKKMRDRLQSLVNRIPAG